MKESGEGRTDPAEGSACAKALSLGHMSQAAASPPGPCLSLLGRVSLYPSHHDLLFTSAEQLTRSYRKTTLGDESGNVILEMRKVWLRDMSDR